MCEAALFTCIYIYDLRRADQGRNYVKFLWQLHSYCYCVFNAHGSVHRNNILIYIQQDATLHSLFYLETTLHVSGGTTTHYQERIQLYLQHLVFVTRLLLFAAIVEELEPVRVCCGWQHTQTGSNSSTIAADSSNRVTNTRCCRYSCMHS